MPLRAVLLSLAALAVPVVAFTARPHWVAVEGAFLVWLPTLVPPFLLAYHRGWHGASIALAGGMAALALVQVEFLLLGLPGPRWPYVFVLVLLLVLVSIGTGIVTELLHRERERAEHTALTDPLTGLANRRHASVFLEAAWAAAVRGHRLSLVLFDLDRFKRVNDAHGHVEGDRVLREVAGILAERTRRMDLCARFGGEEFLAVLVDCGIEQAEKYAEEVRARVGAHDFGWGSVTVSAGVSAIEDGMGSPDILIAAADRALYAAKVRGRDCVVRADGSLTSGPLHSTAALPRVDTPRDLVGIRVLLVDDDDTTLRATARVLDHFGCVVHAAGTAREAIDILSRDTPLDVVITDIVMPDMSGFTLVDVACKVRTGLPALYVSGYPQEEVYWGGTPGARSAFLSKPLEIEELRTTLLELLDPYTAARGPAPGSAGRPTVPTAPSASERGPVDVWTDPERRSARKREGRILVVDDDEPVVLTLQRLFARAGYDDPIGVTDPTAVVDILRTERVDLVILDLYMPGMDGFEVLAAISGIIAPEEYLPVLMLTGDSDPVVRRRALEAGAMDFLNKPFDPAEAEARVRNLLAARFLNQRVALQRDTLEDRVLARTAELADTRSEILHRLARAAEYRDDVTGRHAERVGLLSSRLAAELGLPPRDVDIIRRTAPLHDVGKIGVPDAILYKAGRLTPTEFEIMKTHTTIGAQILGGSTHRLLEVARGIALCHHERWDGLGYPHGSSGQSIPLEARIVAVVDSFDTITHTRPYKEALTAGLAMEEILRCRGTHYDPDVADAFAAIAERVGIEQIQGLADPLDPSRDTMGPTPAEW